MSDPEFLPCPFCGSTIVGALQESSDKNAKLGVVGCGVCGARGPSLFEGEELTRQWNSRASSGPISQPVAIP